MMWQTQTTIEYPFALRPASIEEAGLFYSQMDEAEDAVLGTVGHIRMDFGASGKEFYADKQELEESIIRRHYGTVAEEEPPQDVPAAVGGMNHGMQAEKNSRKTILRP